MRLPRAWTSRQGVALPLALFTLVIAAVMITAVFYVGRLEQRMGNNSVAATQAFEAAETGVTTVMNNWSPATYNTLTTGTTVALPVVAVGPNATYAATIRRLNTNLYLIQAEGRYLVGGAAVTRRQVARVVRLDAPSIFPEGALINRRNLAVTSGLVDGRDQVPSGWSGCSTGSDTPAVVDSAGGTTFGGSCGAGTCLDGSGIAPHIVTDALTVNTNTFATFGGMTYDALAAVADKVVSGNMSALGPTFNPGPTCRTSDAMNWGSPEDPNGPCGQYFPVIYAPGDLEVSGGSGQGILLVDGHLLFSGGARFFGIIIVKGNIDLNAGQITGTVFVKNEGNAINNVAGTQIRYSRCAIEKATGKASQPSPITERGWVQLY